MKNFIKFNKIQAEKDAATAHIKICKFFVMSKDIPCHWFHERWLNVILMKTISFFEKFEAYWTPSAMDKHYMQVYDDDLH